MRLIAHRGFDAQYSANTVAAVEGAVPHADMVELDVRQCASGELVVAHDALVEIDVDGVDTVDDLTAAELADLDAHDGEGIQTLPRVLESVPPDVGVNLELKDAAAVPDAVSLAASLPHEVVVSSFDADAIRRVDDPDDAGVELAYVVGLRPWDGVDLATDLDCRYLHPHAWLCLLTGIVGRAHDAGMCVNAWTVDSRPAAWALASRGVDGLIASSPHVTDWVE